MQVVNGSLQPSIGRIFRSSSINHLATSQMNEDDVGSRILIVKSVTLFVV
jgi:hypothetical protein